MDNFKLVTIGSAITERQTADKILSCNKETEKYGLVLNEQQALALAYTRTCSLKESKRIDLNGSVVDKLILTFCDSPYLTKNNYEAVLHELIGMFYDLKNNTLDTVSDSGVIEFMKNAFNGRCGGSLELLWDEALNLSEHIRCGGNIKNFKA